MQSTPFYNNNNNNNNGAFEDFGFVIFFGLKITIQMSSFMCILDSFFPAG